MGVVDDGTQSPYERILAAVAARDRIIERQGLVMSLATQVINETSTEKAVEQLVHATYRVVNCERVSLFLVEKGNLVCQAAPAGGSIGWKVPLGAGIAGRVAETGQTMIIDDAYQCPLFSSSHDQETDYKTMSILCMPLQDRAGETLGVLQAINKKGPSPHIFSKFDSMDERMMKLLLALTSQQLRVCELIAGKEAANERTSTTIDLVETVCLSRDFDEAIPKLATAARRLLNCQFAFVLMKEQDGMVCRACAPPDTRSIGLKYCHDDEFVGMVTGSGASRMLDRDNNSREIELLEEKLFGGVAGTHVNGDPAQPARRIFSAVLSPLAESELGDSFGMLLAINRAEGLENVTHCPSVLGNMMRKASSTGSIPIAEAAWEHEVTKFRESDMEQLHLLLRLAGHFVQTSNLYDDQRRTTEKLEALLTLLSEANTASQERDASRVISLILAKSLVMFECDRCTFFTVDSLNNEFVGYFALHGGDDGQLQELRVPIKGIAGCAASTNTMLNIRDAWTDDRFCNSTDLKTGFRTKTILCAPITSTAGKVIAVVQCVNKEREAYFGQADENMLSAVSRLLADLIQRLVQDSTYESFIQSNDAIDSDVKDMFREYGDHAKKGKRLSGTGFGASPMPPEPTKQWGAETWNAEVEGRMRCWEVDCEAICEEQGGVHLRLCAALNRFGLTNASGINFASLETLVEKMRKRYSRDVSYHNWSHAFSTLHATFLLLDREALAGLLPQEDHLGLLLASLGHDIEHPGYTNTFLINTSDKLAIRYNDLAVLENHHASTTCGLIASDPSLLQGLSGDALKRVRLVIVASILGTDMVKHQECITWLEGSRVDLPNCRRTGNKLTGEEALKMGVAVVHSADLVHPVLSWRIHKRRSLMMATEFFNQFEEEQKLGLPTIPFMGKNPAQLKPLGPIQVGFIQFVAAPLWSALNFAVGEEKFAFIKRNCESNRKIWQSVADGHEVGDEQPWEQPPNEDDQ